jgi:alanine-glyoxylate transaminase/serine-glyoxylate transaminase/serine-pyruvate transaminase
MFARYGAAVSRLDVAWGQAVDPAAVERRLRESPFDLVGVVHGETSTGVCNPVADIARLTRAHDALLVVDAVTTLGAVPLEVEAWGVDACYSCSQKGLGAPSGLSPVVFSARALDRRVECRSFYFDLALLEAYWLERKYHHTISAPLVFALAEALAEVEDEGLDARWRRHEVVHRTFVDALAERELSLLPAPDDRLRSLNAVMVPPGVVEADVRAALRRDGIEIGAGLGPLAGRIWRVGLMGTGATPENVTRVSEAIGAAIAASAA